MQGFEPCLAGLEPAVPPKTPHLYGEFTIPMVIKITLNIAPVIQPAGRTHFSQDETIPSPLISLILSSSSGVDVPPLRVLALARIQYTPLECDLGLNPACLIRANLLELRPSMFYNAFRHYQFLFADSRYLLTIVLRLSHNQARF
ncbi:uncharacterized protein METZ01_LOCUS13560 [marine metagenome]|uniref:Uncharacterized protein n=1 Tax=marine metagenome TaxID=408172 RepID=A0A381P1A4_9ZZZZ